MVGCTRASLSTGVVVYRQRESGGVQIKNCGDPTYRVDRKTAPGQYAPEGPVPIDKKQEVLRRRVQHSGNVNSKGEAYDKEEEPTLLRESRGQLESSWKKLTYL